MVRDQADELRQLVRQKGHGAEGVGQPRLIVISGGKGGVGATTIALNLAAALTRNGRRTLLVDADLGRVGAGAWRDAPRHGSIVDVLSGRQDLHEALERGPAGMQILAGAWAPEEVFDCSAAQQQRFIAQLRGLATHADAVVVDAGSARNHFVRRFWHSADLVLLVTTIESASIMDAYAAAKLLLAGDASIPLETVVNAAPSASAADDVHARISQACRRFLGLRVSAAGYVAVAANGEGAAEDCSPLFDASSEAGACAARLAETIWNRLASTSASRGRMSPRQASRSA
jgi:flagellar biosynthesis protein FlhG